jgi:agmatine deiminase
MDSCPHHTGFARRGAAQPTPAGVVLDRFFRRTLFVSIDSASWPAASGYRMPAEWEPHEATWLSWPHNRATWPGCFDLVEPTMVEVVRALAETERVHINVLHAEHEAHVRALLDGSAPAGQIELHRCPTDDAWIRDHGAIFVCATVPGQPPRLALDFDYNAWGGKYPPFEQDRRVARYMADVLGVPRFEPGLVLEGGSVDVNGAGVMFTTEQCLLNQNRNPSLGRAEIETALRAAFGVREIVWLGDGIVGDDTDGHVDDLTRFVSADTVVTVVEARKEDENHAALAANRRALDGIEIDGRALKVVELPMPAPLFNAGERLPASYANFYIANEIVLVPIFDCAQDAHALDVLAGCFGDRRVVGVDCRSLVAGLGALHCLTQQLPRVPEA